MDRRLPDNARRALDAAGLNPIAVLGAGMEGVVVDLGADRVAKVWFRSSPPAAQRLQVFYDAEPTNAFSTMPSVPSSGTTGT